MHRRRALHDNPTSTMNEPQVLGEMPRDRWRGGSSQRLRHRAKRYPSFLGITVAEIDAPAAEISRS